MDNAERIWVWFKQHTEITNIGIAAIMGNIQAESNFVPNIVQRGMGVKMTDAEYTSAADDGSIPFYNDAVGYGLFQHTYWSRKKALLAYAKSKGKSVGDLETQLEFMLTESEWKSIYSQIAFATDLYSATALFCARFENPAVKNNDTRYVYAQAAYAKYHGMQIEAAKTEPETSEDEEEYITIKVPRSAAAAFKLAILNGGL